MKSVGVYLKERRLATEVALASISKNTKIKEKFLIALEDSDWGVLPSFATAQGFARSYANAVGLDPQVVVALLRRDFPGVQASARSSEISLKKTSIWTPRTTILAIAVSSMILLVWYLTRQYLTFAVAPPLEIKEFIVKDELNQILITGRTATSASLEINGRAVLVENDGTFNLEIAKSNVGSMVEIKARSRTGKETIVRKPLTN